MITVPVNDKVELLRFANELIEQCRISVGNRATQCRVMNIIAETGRYDGSKSLINMLHNHLTRTAANIFSPIELKFAVDFENTYPKKELDRAQVAAKLLTRSWERTNIDMAFGQGVFEALKYGACLLKQWVQLEGKNDTPVYHKKLVMPWQFGVYNESENELDRQAALCETSAITMPEVWRRICHLPDAKTLYQRIQSHARKGASIDEPQSYFHQVLSSSTLNTSGIDTATRPGGLVSLTNDANYSVMGPQIGAALVNIHELWVQDDDDYTTIIMVDPDIIIAPLYKKANLLVAGSGLQPYRLIQPNAVTNWFWGRPELMDLVEPQALLSRWCDDAMRLFGLQVDKLMAFIGQSGMDDERYAQFRNNGWMSMEQGGSVSDLTPKIFPEMMPLIKFVIETINTLGSTPEILQGKGESGVRAGTHANTLLKTASPTLRDRALLVERQCATAGDLTMAIREAKDGNRYWTDGTSLETIDKTAFLLGDLPEDWRVTVDSHSSSPIFSDENAQLIFAGQKAGVVGPKYMTNNLPFPNKADLEAERVEIAKEKAATTQKLLAEHPEVGESLAKKMLAGGGKR